MRWLIPILSMLALAGCQTTEPPEPVVDLAGSMEFLEAGLRPEVLLFPDYLLMEDFELNQHGRIPETTLVGAGMKTDLSLAAVRRRFNDVLDESGWTIDKVEIEKQSFRVMASLKGDHVEIRAAKGSGPTQVFMLYQYSPENTPLEL